MRTKLKLIGAVRNAVRRRAFLAVAVLAAVLLPHPALAVDLGPGLRFDGDAIEVDAPLATTLGGTGVDGSNVTANQVLASPNGSSGALATRALVDNDVPDTITASNYLPLSGGTLTGQLGADNLGIEFDESDTNPTCDPGNFNVFADLSDNKLKKCENGSVTDLDTTSAGSSVSLQGFSTTTSIDLDSGGTATVYVSPFSGAWFTDESKAKVPYDSGTIGDFRCRASGTTGADVTAEIVAGACDSTITTDCSTGDACVTITAATSTAADADTEAVSDGNCVVVELTTAGNPGNVTYSCSWTFTR